VTNHARAERLALCSTLLQVGPAAETLCEGWLTRDLAAHLTLRDHRPDAQVGTHIPALAGYTQALQDKAAARPFGELVDAVRSGPPLWSPTRLAAVDRVVNTAEFYVHHEDVLRAQPGWTPRPVSKSLQRALWPVCATVAQVAMRSAPVSVELVAPGYGRKVVTGGEPLVQVEGAPGELLLFVFGRRQVAQVQLAGPPGAVEQLVGAGAAR
jgi:uncharacterized protein (TIGR03085 family)